jgi:flavorubredoxin
MKDSFQAVKISDNVYWVGAIDWSIRDFHGYLTSRGSTYNAFLIVADKITLIDTVKSSFKNELIARISSVVNPEKIDYIVSHHAEMDHSGSLTDIIRLTNPEKVFASKTGVRVLQEHFDFNMPITPVQNGETIDLGNMKLTFYDSKMLHWPESMISYLHEDKILFSQDGFGSHLATFERFSDEVNENLWLEEAAKYYANILLPYSKLILKLLDTLSTLNIEINVIATDHGPLWRGEDIDKIISLYKKWAIQTPTDKAVVMYDTMWGSTDLMARAIGEGLYAGGANVRLMPTRGCHRSDLITEILDAGALIVGAPTINNMMFPQVQDSLSYIRGLKPANLIGFSFGSYGWSGEAPKQLRKFLEDIKVDIVIEELRVKNVPKAVHLKECFDAGKTVGEILKKNSGCSFK